MSARFSALSACIAVGACGPVEAEVDQTQFPGAVAASLTGELPEMVRLPCGKPWQNEPETIDYEFRFFFTERLWDSKRSFGAWSPYGTINEVTEDTIAVASASSSFVFDRSELSVTEYQGVRDFASGPTLLRTCVVSDVRV